MPNETAAIVRLYGEIDRKVNVDASRRIKVAQLLWPYVNPTLHWYDDYQEWLGETPIEGDSAFPGVEPALKHLAANEDLLPRARARRIFAIAVLTRAFPEMKREGNPLGGLAIEALRAIPGAEETEGGAEHLYGLLADDEPMHTEAGTEMIQGTKPWWNEMVAPFGPRAIGMQPKPCVGRWVRVPGLEGPVDAVRTEYEPEGITLTQAAKFLDPENWPNCSDFWCEMKCLEKPAAGQGRYREVVSTSCGSGPRPDFTLPDFWAETELLFNFMWIPEENGAQAAVANFRLVPDPRYKDDLIVLDEGTLVVARVKDTDRLLVTTTKRVRFSREFMPGAIAVLACAFGYADLSNDLLACAARLGVAGGTSFPGVAVNAAPAANGAGAAGPRTGSGQGSAGGPRSGSGQGSAGGFVQEGADIAIRAIRDWADLLETVGGAGKQGTPKRRRRPGG